MAVPSNLSADTAITISSLPFATIQNVRDNVTTYTVWYRYVSVADDLVLGFFGFGDLVTYQPVPRAFKGPASGLTLIAGGIANKPAQFKVSPLTEYFFSFTTNSASVSPANLIIQVQSSPKLDVLAGSIFVPDDISSAIDEINFVLSPTISYKIFATNILSLLKEQGDILSNGNMLWISSSISGVSSYDRNFRILNTTSLTGSTANYQIRSNRTTHKFYVADGNNTVRIYTLNNVGASLTLKATITTQAPPIGPIASNNDETILYFTTSVSATNLPVKRWNLTTDLAMSDLVVGVVGYRIVDILGLDDGTILVGYGKTIVPQDLFVRRYNAAGTILNTYSFGGATTILVSDFQRMAYALDHPNSFWVWLHEMPAIGLSRFINVKVSDGAVLSTVDHSVALGSVLYAAASATPASLFGHSSSCPFLILTKDMTPSYTGLYKLTPTISTQTQTHDTLYINNAGGNNILFKKKIPDPFGTVYLAKR